MCNGYTNPTDNPFLGHLCMGLDLCGIVFHHMHGTPSGILLGINMDILIVCKIDVVVW